MREYFISLGKGLQGPVRSPSRDTRPVTGQQLGALLLQRTRDNPAASVAADPSFIQSANVCRAHSTWIPKYPLKTNNPDSLRCYEATLMLTRTPATAAQTFGSKTQNRGARGGVRGLSAVRKRGVFRWVGGSQCSPGTGTGACQGT